MSANIKASVDGTQAIIGVGGVDQMTVSNSGVVTANSFVGNITGNVIGGTLSGNASSATALATGSTTARTLANRFAEIINIKDFGAVGDGVADDTPFIQAAINQAQLLNTSCVVYIPATQFSYRTTATLTITRNIKLVGDCILTPMSNTPATKVSKLYFDHLGIGINITGGNARGTWVEGLELERKQPAPSTVVPTPWTPSAADFDIVVQLNAYSVTITDCLISSATKAIKAFSLGYGQLNILHCKIWAFDIGMEFDGCYDVCRVDNVHIWPFRLQNQNVFNYTLNNLIGILTKRNDNPHISNLFTYACKYGIQFSGSSLGITERAFLNNCGFDRNGQAGIYFEVGSNYSSALISNCYCARGEYAIKCDASVITAQISNFRSSIVNKNAINITGVTLNNFQITNLALDLWDQDLANNPAIVCPSGTSNRLFITGDILVETGGTPPVAAPVIGNIGGIDSFEWFNQTAALSSETGTLTDATCSIFIRKQNKTLKFEIQIIITDAGTAAGGLLIAMPYNAGFRTIPTGRILNTAVALSAQMNAGGNIITCKKYDGTTPIATGNFINITGEYYTGL